MGGVRERGKHAGRRPLNSGHVGLHRSVESLLVPAPDQNTPTRHRREDAFEATIFVEICRVVDTNGEATRTRHEDPPDRSRS